MRERERERESESAGVWRLLTSREMKRRRNYIQSFSTMNLPIKFRL